MAVGFVGKGEAGVKPVVLRMRNVTWSGSARSTNRPSLVLYVHTVDDPDHAVSYVWSDPGAARLGVNLRWMQASCTVDGAEQPPEITPKPVHREAEHNHEAETYDTRCSRDYDGGERIGKDARSHQAGRRI